MQPPTPIRASLIGLVSVAFLIASTQIATPANAADTPVPVPVVVAETGAVESGASSDTDAIGGSLSSLAAEITGVSSVIKGCFSW